MNCKKYRICLILLIVFVLAGSAFYYVWSEKRSEVPEDGLLEKNCVEDKDAKTGEYHS